MENDKALVRLCDGIGQLIKKLETLERCIDKLTNVVNDLTVCIESAPLYEDAELADGEAEHVDGYPADPAKTH